MTNQVLYSLDITASELKIAKISKAIRTALGKPYNASIQTRLQISFLREASETQDFVRDIKHGLAKVSLAFPDVFIDACARHQDGRETDWQFITKSKRYLAQEIKRRGYNFPVEPDYIDKKIAKEYIREEWSIDLSQAFAISDEAAKILAKSPNYLYLEGLEEISIAAIQHLSSHRGGICLSGLESLSDDAACCLANHVGELALNGLPTLSVSAAKSLRTHKGNISLMGLERLKAQASAFLAENPSISTSLKGKAKKKVSRGRKGS